MAPRDVKALTRTEFSRPTTERERSRTSLELAPYDHPDTRNFVRQGESVYYLDSDDGLRALTPAAAKQWSKHNKTGTKEEDERFRDHFEATEQDQELVRESWQRQETHRRCARRERSQARSLERTALACGATGVCVDATKLVVKTGAYSAVSTALTPALGPVAPLFGAAAAIADTPRVPALRDVVPRVASLPNVSLPTDRFGEVVPHASLPDVSLPQFGEVAGHVSDLSRASGSSRRGDTSVLSSQSWYRKARDKRATASGLREDARQNEDERYRYKALAEETAADWKTGNMLSKGYRPSS